MPIIELPDQRVSRDEKLKKNFYKPTYDYFVNKALSLNNKDDVQVWLEAANGLISHNSLNYLTSPLKNENNRETNKLPGEIRETDLINTVREKNLGEYIGLPYTYSVNVFNADAVLKRDLDIREKANTLIQQALINKLNEYYEQTGKGINTGMESKEVPDIEKCVEEELEKWVDDRAKKGLNLLKLINEVNDFDNKRIQAFFYWWACEEFYTYREIINNEVYTSIISPLEGYPIINGEQFVEDYTGFVIKKKVTLTKVKELYWNKFDKSEQEYLKQLAVGSKGSFVTKGVWLSTRIMDSDLVNQYKTVQADMEFDVTDNFESLWEYTIIWRTEVPVTIRKYSDPFGNIHEEAVAGNYIKSEEDIDVYTEWIEEVYIGKRFGDENTGIYLPPTPCDVQRYDKHTYHPKLPVGGKKGLLLNIKQNPICKRLIPYILIDRMILLEQERTMAQWEPYLKVIPQSMMNSDAVGTKKEKMFYIKADRTLFYDDSIVDYNVVAQGFRVVAMPEVAQYLKTLIDLRDKYKQEGLEIANMNDYSLGDINPTTGKGVMQEGIYRARLGNVLSITMFHAALERDHNADLEFSKFAYQDDVRSSFIDRKSGKQVYVELNLQEHRETDYGVSVENSKVDQKKLEEFRQLAFNASQNGDIDAAIEAIDHDSIPELRQALRQVSKAKKELEEKLERDRNETQRYVADKQEQIQEAKNQVEIYKADKASETAITVADINSEPENNNVEPDLNTLDDGSDMAFKRDQLNFKINDANTKNLLKEKQMRTTERINTEKMKLAKNKPTTSK